VKNHLSSWRFNLSSLQAMLSSITMFFAFRPWLE
jgi:hypothetical protein